MDDLKRKETGEIFKIVGKVFRRGHAMWVGKSQINGREILIDVLKVSPKYEWIR